MSNAISMLFGYFVGSISVLIIFLCCYLRYKIKLLQLEIKQKELNIRDYPKPRV